MTNLKEMLIKEIIKDEQEYCFNEKYCDNKTWEEENRNQTREEAFNEAINSFENKSVEEILEFFGDKYDYVLEQNK